MEEFEMEYRMKAEPHLRQGGVFKEISCGPGAIAVRTRDELGSALGLNMVDQGRPKPALNTESKDKQR